MATAEQIRVLVKSHFDSDTERFTTVALQLAAHEARQGHSILAHHIRSVVDKARSERVRAISFDRGLDGLVLVAEPRARLSELIVPQSLRSRIDRILQEYRQQEKLRKHGLRNRRKILLTGPPGTGKTMTASVIAGEVHLPFYTILMDKLITKFMGETSAKLRQIFEIIQKRRGLYLFDEFDAIGAERGLDNDVGEMRRVLNAFLQFIEGDDSDSLIVAATNNLRLLDQALFRRFDDVLHYQLPKKEEAVRLINNRIGTFKGRFSIDRLIRKNIKLSHAEVAQACDDAIKEAILCDRRGVTGNSLHVMLREHQAAHRGTKGGA